ncbi:MAG: hypothetical protein ACP5E3_08230 [Bacteroidales bacterium]
MSNLKPKTRTGVKISSMQDLKLMKERYRYEVKLNEQSFKTEFSYFRSDLRSAARQTLNNLIEKMLISLTLKLLKK